MRQPWVEELFSDLELIEAAGTVMIAMFGKSFAEFDDGIGRGHGEDQLKLSMADYHPIRFRPVT